jgi:hypothetical protein
VLKIRNQIFLTAGGGEQWVRYCSFSKMKTIDVCFYVGEENFNINNLPSINDTISIQRDTFEASDTNIIDSIINEAIMRLGKKHQQEDFEEILKSDKFKFKVSLESFCEAPDGSRISGFVGADFFYEVVQAGINEKELLAELLAEEVRSSSKSTDPKKLASSKKSQNEKKSSSGDI